MKKKQHPAPKPSTAAEATQGAAKNDGGNIVYLDVGGYKFVTSRETLSCVPGSHLEALVSGRHAKPARRSKEGHLFIDRDGKYFQHILNFLRVGGNVVSPLPAVEASREALAVEADFYGLEDLCMPFKCQRLTLKNIWGKKHSRFVKQRQLSVKTLRPTNLWPIPARDSFPSFVENRESLRSL